MQKKIANTKKLCEYKNIVKSKNISEFKNIREFENMFTIYKTTNEFKKMFMNSQYV